MRWLKSTLWVVFFSAVSLSAQTLDEIIAKNLQAHGGVDKLKAVQTMRITGNFEIGPLQAEFTQVYKRPMKVRLDAPIQGMVLTQAYDGQNGWKVIPFTGKIDPEPMNDEELKRVQEEADFDGPLMDYKQKGNTVKLVGKEKVDGRDAYHLSIVLKTGEVRNMYLDATSFLAIKLVSSITLQGSPVDLESRFSNYTQVQGITIPFSIEQHAATGELPDEKITFRKVEMNVPLDDFVFKMPSASPPAAPATDQPKKPDSQSKPPQN